MPVGQGPYTYSDMTGFQLRNAAAPTGRFRHTFQGCNTQTRWNRVSGTADYEGGTAIVVNARTGKDVMDLNAQPFPIGSCRRTLAGQARQAGGPAEWRCSSSRSSSAPSTPPSRRT